MPSRRSARFIAAVLLAAAVPAWGQSGLRVPERGEQGLDPTFARGWLAPDFDRFGFATHHWNGFAPGQRKTWSFSFGEKSSLGLSVSETRDLDDPRQLSVYGRYWVSPDWAVSAESSSREPQGLLRLQDFRIGVQRRF